MEYMFHQKYCKGVLSMTKKTVLWIAIIAMAIIPVYAQEEEEPIPENVFKTHPINGGRELEITGYIGHEWEVSIPSELNNLPITSIGEGAFQNHTSITHIILPDTVTNIGVCAFLNCSDLLDVIIPDSVKTIGDEAFSGCVRLSYIILPSSITRIGRYAFYDCRALVSVTFLGTIPSSGFNNDRMFPSFPGNIRTKFYEVDRNNGTPGTYTRISRTTIRWTKQK
jgi:hypothetical protein